MNETSSLGNLQRHEARWPCPVCGGHAGLPRHRGVRCAGFTLDRVVYCTREEQAGSLPFDMTVSPGAYQHRRFGACGCGNAHGWGSVVAAHEPTYQRQEIASIERRHEVYSFALSILDLRSEALHDLRRRGLSEAAIAGWRFRSVPRLGNEHREFMARIRDRFDDGLLRRCPGFLDKNGRLTFCSAQGDRDGYIVPYVNEVGRLTGWQQKRLGGGYLSPAGAQLDLVYAVAGRPAPGCDLYLTEGGTKAIVAHELAGLTVFAVAGQALMPAHIAAIKRLEPARVVVCLDREQNVNTDRVRQRWLERLAAEGLPTFDGAWEGSDLGGLKGLDDLCGAGERPRLRRVTVIPAAISARRTPREVPVTGDVDRGVPIATARTITAAAIDDFISDADRHRGDALLVHTPPGTGKTTATARALEAARAQGRIVVGTNRLAAELAAEFDYAQIQGRNDENCERIDVVRALSADDHGIEELACGTEKKPRCPARTSCAYWRQFDQIGTRVAAAEQLFNPRFLQGGSVVVVDDADLLRSTIERHLITVETLSRAYKALARRRRERTRRVLAAIGHALLDVQLDDEARLPLLGATVWDRFAASARRHNVDLVAAILALPANGTLPPPGTSDQDVLCVEDVATAVPATVTALLDALREELPSFLSGEDFNSRFRIDQDGMHVFRVRQPATDRLQREIVAELPLLVLEATPIPSLVECITAHHTRLPDVRVDVSLPENVTVVQHAGSSNSRTVLRDPERLKAALSEVSAERDRFPIANPNREAAICFRFVQGDVVALGIATEQVLTFGSVRGLNALSNVDRLHVIGRPMAPTPDLLHLAQVIHHEEAPINPQVIVEARRFGGQRYEVDVVDFEDPRAAALVKATRDDEMVQVIHRARLFSVDSQSELFGTGRQSVRLVLHTGHPIPGLRVDELHVTAVRRDINSEREADAEQRIAAAIEQIRGERKVLTVNAIARAAGAHKQTVAKVMGKPVHTLRDLSNKGMNHLPQSPSADREAAASDGLCRGGCGRTLPEGHNKCAECAAAAVAEWRRSRAG
jgi:hypothetical protein